MKSDYLVDAKYDLEGVDFQSEFNEHTPTVKNQIKKRKTFSKEEREIIWNKCNHRCAYCGSEITLKQMQVDHFIPFSLIQDENTDEMINLMPACRSCNHYKSSLTIEKFRHQIESILNTLNRDNVTYRIGCRYGLISEHPQNIKFYYETLGIDVNR